MRSQPSSFSVMRIVAPSAARYESRLVSSRYSGATRARRSTARMTPTTTSATTATKTVSRLLSAHVSAWVAVGPPTSAVALPAAATLRAVSPVSYTHLRAHETRHDLVCRLLLEKKKITSHQHK